MPHINADIPPFDCFVWRRYLNGDSNDAGFVKARAFGISSVPRRALGFHVLDEVGAVIWRLPIHALALHDDAVPMPLDHLQLWDCTHADVGVTEFQHLSRRLCQVLIKDGKKIEGRYLFTVDWAAGEGAEPGHKCAHVIALNNGCLAAQPNNRILWADPATITKPFATVPRYVTNLREWTCEGASRWTTEDSDQMFYGVLAGVEPGADNVVMLPQRVEEPGQDPGHKSPTRLGSSKQREARRRADRDAAARDLDVVHFCLSMMIDDMLTRVEAVISARAFMLGVARRHVARWYAVTAP